MFAHLLRECQLAIVAAYMHQSDHTSCEHNSSRAPSVLYLDTQIAPYCTSPGRLQNWRHSTSLVPQPASFDSRLPYETDTSPVHLPGISGTQQTGADLPGSPVTTCEIGNSL